MIESTCKYCGCTDTDCSGCIKKTGNPCYWIDKEKTICSACYYAEDLVLSKIKGSNFKEEFYRKQEELYSKATSEWEGKLESYLLNNLKNLGYEFANEDKFTEFLKTRVTRIRFEGRHNYYVLCLDYKVEENKGKIIGVYSEEMKIVQNSYETKVTLNRVLEKIGL